MTTQRKPEGLELVLTLILILLLTLLTAVPLLAILQLTSSVAEFVVALAVFGAWSLITTMLTPWVQRRWPEEPEQAR